MAIGGGRFTRAARWLEPVARIGIAAKGAVYLAIGAVAVRSALLHRGRVADSQRALVEIAAAPLGSLFLVAVAIGLCGYVLWRLLEALVDPERRGPWRRIGSLGIAALYASLALSAIKLWAWGERPRGGNRTSRALTGDVLDLPGGPWLLGAAAAGVIVFGAIEIVRGVIGRLPEALGRGISARETTWAVRLARAGLVARGATFMIIGGYGMAAALEANPRLVQGLAGALRTLARSGGGLVLALVGLGLASYGLYTFFEARYRHLSST